MASGPQQRKTDSAKTDLKFFTNRPNETLLDRFVSTLQHVRFFDVLVGYFRTSGFYSLYEHLENAERIRILVGLSLDRNSFQLLEEASAGGSSDFESHKRCREIYSGQLIQEMEVVDDSAEVEIAARKFIEFIQSGRMELKAHPSRNIHAKVYISRFPENFLDFGRVITGSSNFSASGLVSQREFNVELKDRVDVEHALDQFEELWSESVDVSEAYIDTVRNRTWLNDQITPYEIYLKCLYEYFQEEINQVREDEYYAPDGFIRLAYQDEAVLSARKIIKKYGGVFLSDVVGLGKTYISALLAQRLQKDGRILVLAPPALLDRNNQGSWPNVFEGFGVLARHESIGQLDKIINEGADKYATVFIDEAHRFRSDDTETYAKLAQICFGKQVVLVTATPYNNSPSDILALIKLFQKPHDSTIPNHRNLQSFFAKLERRAKRYDRKADYENYIRVVRDNAKSVRENVLKHLMIRRTRSEVLEYFSDDMGRQGLSFPEVTKPEPIFYKLNEHEENVFTETINLMANLTYARYAPLLYLKSGIKPQQAVGQRNMRGFIKTLLVKRMESSIPAFRATLKRFLRSYEMFLKAFEEGSVYFSPKHTTKIFDALELDNDEAIDRLLEPVKPYDLKHHTIHESLYGVDVDNGAIEIAKLRLWLSLIVDEDEFREVHALPNLDYKIMQGNALLQSYAGIKLFEDRLVTAHDNLIRRQRQLEEELQDLQSRLMNFLTNSETAANPGEKRNLEKAIKEKSRELQKLKQQPKTEDDLPLLAGQSSASALAEELERLHEEIFQETTQGRKNELRTKIAVLEWELIKASLKEQGREDEIPVVSRLQEANNKPYFLWKLHFSNVFFSDNGGGFDIVIANPPYVRHEEIKELKPALKSEFGDFFKGTADLYTYFYKRGIDLLAPHGHLCFIAPNKFFRAGYGSRLQQTLKNEVSLKEIIDFRDLPIFDSTTYPAVILLEKAQPSEENTFQAAVFTEESQLEDVSLSFPKAAFSMQRSDLDDGGWLLAPTDVTALRRKLRNAGTPLGEYVNGRFYYGIKTGLNDAFVIDGTTRERLISEDPKCAEIIKPWLRGKDIKRWHARWSGLYVIFTRRGVDINRYPSVKGHLEKYRHELEPKKNSSQKKGRKPGSYKWFEIQDNIAYHEEFECPKIVWGNLAKFPKFSYDSGSYVSAPANIIPTADTFLLAILNSPVCEWLISLNAAERFGGYLEFKPMYVGQVPVPHCSEADRERLSAWVQAILKAKRGDSEADVSELESKINEEVYKFYDLTADEIALIEEATTQVNVHGDAVGKTFALQGPS